MNKAESMMRGLILTLVLSIPLAAAEPVPATVAEIRDCIDWSKVPLLPGASAARPQFSLTTYKAPTATFLEAAEFFRKSLPPLGWVEDKTPISGVDQKDYLSLTFEKGAMRMGINGYRSEPKEPMTVTLSLSGNVDLRPIPKPADGKILADYRNSIYYTTAAEPKAAAETVRKAILERGWTEVPDPSNDFHAKEGRFVSRFVKNAMQIMLVSSKSPEGKTQLNYSSSVRHEFDPAEVKAALLPKEIPAPAAIKDYVEVIDFRKFPLMEKAAKLERRKDPLAMSHGLNCQVPAKFDDVVSFHRKEFATRGWTETGAEFERENHTSLHFEKQGYLVAFSANQEKGKPDVTVGIVNLGNVDLRQLPWPAGVEIPAWRQRMLNATTTLSQDAAKEFYKTELPKQGWKIVEKPRYGMEFTQNASRLQVNVGKLTTGETSLQVTPSLVGVE